MGFCSFLGRALCCAVTGWYSTAVEIILKVAWLNNTQLDVLKCPVVCYSLFYIMYVCSVHDGWIPGDAGRFGMISG